MIGLWECLICLSRPNALPLVAIQSSATTNLFYDLGYLNAMVLHPYYDWGYQASEVLIKKLFKKQSPANNVTIPEPILVNWENIDVYKNIGESGSTRLQFGTTNHTNKQSLWITLFLQTKQLPDWSQMLPEKIETDIHKA